MAWVDFDAKCQTGGNLKRFLAANGAKKIGKSMACPFHNDKSPSASYYLKDGVELFNCFTCGIKGDIFNVYRKVNGVTNKSELNKLVGDFCGVTLPTFKKVEAPKYKFVKRVESAEIIKARKRAVEQYKALFKTPKGDALVFKNPPVPLVDKPSVAVEKPTELNVEKPAIKTPELKQNANVELKQTPKVELKPTAEKYVYFEKRKDFQNVFTNFENKPAKVFDLPSELNNLPRNLTASVKEWRDKQYAIFKNPKYKPNAAESIFISIEFNALKHCGFADFEARRGDYMRVAEWRARRAYVAWYSNKGDSNEKI